MSPAAQTKAKAPPPPQFVVVAGAHINAKDAQALGEELWELSGGNMRALTVEELWTYAKNNPQSLAHRYIFNVSVQEAARQYQLIRARWVLRSLGTIELVRGEATTVRAFEHIEVTEGTGVVSGYKATMEMMQVRTERDYIVNQAYEQMESFVAKYEKYLYLAKVTKAARGMLKILKALRAAPPVT